MLPALVSAHTTHYRHRPARFSWTALRGPPGPGDPWVVERFTIIELAHWGWMGPPDASLTRSAVGWRPMIFPL